MILRLSLAILLVFITSNSILAQSDKVEWHERLATYYLQSAPKGNEFLINILASHKGNYTLKELNVLAMSFCKNTYSGIKNQPDKEHFVYSCLLDSLKEMECNFKELSASKKREHILRYMAIFEPVYMLCLMQKHNTWFLDKLHSHVEYYSENLYGYRKLLNVSNPDDLQALGSIYRSEAIVSFLYQEYDYLLHNFYPELLELHNNENPMTDLIIKSVMTSLKEMLITNGNILFQNKYIGERTDFLLYFNSLFLLPIGDKRLNGYENKTWTKIKASLKKDECAVLMYKTNDNNTLESIGGFAITYDCFEPKEIGADINLKSPNDFIATVKEKLPHCNKIYLCPIDELGNIDVAYCDSRVYLKYSLFDLIKQKESPSLNNKCISYMGNIDYGEKKNYKDFDRLKNDINLITYLEELYGNKIHFLTGKNVKKVNFYNIFDNVGILHISTHGKAVPTDMVQTRLDIGKTILGEMSLSGYGLVLSDYNENNRNFLSARDIKNIRMPNELLVFLDACFTGVNSDVGYSKSSVAKSFYIAGARNIITYNIEVKEDFASDFAKKFYMEIHNNPDISYHEAFYKVKKIMYDNSKDYLLDKDLFGRNNLGIMLWE